MSKVKKNDWIAINLNMPENGTLADLAGYGINTENTSIQDENYYKGINRVRENELFQGTDGNFDESKFHQFYQSALRSFNDFQNTNFLNDVLNSIESSPYDTFSLGDGRPIAQDTAVIYNSRDPYRTTVGLKNLFEVGTPTFDVREVAQANKARDENGNILDWTPNDKGFLKGLFRPTMVLATYDEDGYYTENGREVFHHKGEYKLDERTGDPYYEILGDRDAYDKETLHFWDTITKDDSDLNKIDFFDSDGLTKSVGGIVARTAFTLLPYFIPNVGPVLGYVGATIALGQSLPVLAKSFDTMLTGTDDNQFGQTMKDVENWFDRFKHSQSRDVQGKFWSFENIGDILATSAGQLFQQRNIANLSRDVFKNVLSPQKNVRLGQQLSLGYMAVTSGEDSYRIAKEAGANDAVAGVMTLGTMAAYYGLFSVDHFKKYLFTNTYMDEDIAMTRTMRELRAKEYPNIFKNFEEKLGKKKNLSEFQRRVENIKLFKDVKDWTTKQLKSLDEKVRPTIKQTNEVNNGAGISFGQRLGMYLTRAGNEAFEETLEETILDVGKGITMGLRSLGVDVTEDDKTLDFGLTWRDAFSRYTSAAIGGALGGFVFESFNHWEGGPYDSLLEKSLDERLAWYYRNGYEKQINDRLELLRKKGKLGNKELSAKPLRTETVDGKDIIVFGSGDENDNQNEFVYNVIKARLENLKTLMNEQQIWQSDNQIFKQILENVRKQHSEESEDDLRARLYHFLEDVDTAKALTITQQGFLDELSKDVDKYANDIINKAREIEAYKQKLREDNHITDASKSQEETIFKKSQKLKALEEELKVLKDAYNQIATGQRNGYYIGLAFMKTNPKYKDYYTSLDGIERAKDPFPKTELQNYAKYRTGLEYDKIEDSDLKEKIKEDYENFLKLKGDDYDRALYDMHIQFSKDFASEIESINQKYKGWHLEYIDKFLLDFYQDEIDSTTDEVEKFLLQQAVSEYVDSAEKHRKIEDANERSKAIEDDFSKLFFRYFSSGYDSETESFRELDAKKAIDLLDRLLKRAVDTKSSVSFNINSIREKILKQILSESFKNSRKEALIKLYTDPNNGPYAKISSTIIDLSNADDRNELYDYAKNVLGFTDDDFTKLELSDDTSASELAQKIDQAVQDKYNLINAGNSDLNILLSKINVLRDAIVNNSSDVGTLYDDILDFVKKNGILFDNDGNRLDDDKVQKLLNDIIGPFGIDLVKFTKDWQSTFDQLLTSPVVELLKKFDIYSGGKAFNVIRLIESEEAFREAQGKNGYQYRQNTTREQLQTALSFLNVVTAILDSSFDGMNEYINLSQEEKLAVTDENLKSLYEKNIESLKGRIDTLIELADANQKQTIAVQQKTEINTKVERIKILTGIGKITFGDKQYVDFGSIWENTGYTLNDASIESEESVKFNDVYDKFESDVHTELNKILKNYLASEKLDDFVDKILHGFSEEAGLYLQDPGEIGMNPVLTPYNNICYLIRLAIQDPNEMKSLFKTATDKNPQLLSLFGQEVVVSEMIASYEDSINGNGLYNLLHEKILAGLKAHPEFSDEPEYTNGKKVAYNFQNTDGGAGVGKTGGCDYLALEILKLKYGEDAVHPVAVAPTEDAKNNLRFALQSDGNVLNYTVDELIAFLTDDGKLFNFASARDDQTNSDFVNKDKNGKTLSDIPADRVEKVLGKGIRALFIFDETGMINKKTMQFFIELAKLHKFFIFGSGDRLQNQAMVGTSTSGIEDMVYHRLPSLTVSMRAEYQGMSTNTDRVRSKLLLVQNLEYTKDGYGKKDYDKHFEKVFKDVTSIDLIYSETNYAGTQKITDDAIDTTIEKLVELTKDLKDKDPERKHQIAIVVDNESRSKYDKYKDNDMFKILTARDIQGKEFDYVLVDIIQDDFKYLALKNFYTLMTRSKVGSVFVDSNNRLSELKINFEKSELASLPVLGGDAESKKAIFKEYIEWKNKLSAKYPAYVRPGTNPEQEEKKPKAADSSGGSNGSSGEGKEVKPVNYELYGTEGKTKEELEELEELRKNRQKRNEHYTERVLNEEIGSKYDQDRLATRNDLLSSSNKDNYIDFDVFLEELRDTTNDIFEKLPGALSQTTDPQKKLYHRAIISTIARGILNAPKPKANTNANTNERLEYIKSASKVLYKFAQIAGIDNKFILDLQESLTDSGNGVFMNYNGYMFYGFTSNNTEYLIPLYKSNDDQKAYYKKDMYFKTEVGDIKITTDGEMRLSINEVFGPIDGLVRDDEGNIQLAILTKTDEIVNWMRRNSSQKHTNPAIGSLFDFFDLSFGKTFLATTGPSSTWRVLDNTFNILRENGRIKNGLNKVYDPTDAAQPFEAIVLQKDITFGEWFELVATLHELAKTGVVDGHGEAYKRLNKFFSLDGDSSVEQVFGSRTTTQTANNAERYKLLGQYKIMQYSSLEGLTSTLIRYLQKLPDDNSLRARFFNNFAEWMEMSSSNDGKNIHRKGFIVRIVTKDNNRKVYHNLRIIPSENGFSIDYIDPTSFKTTTIYTASDTKISSLLDGLDYNFNRIPIQVFDILKSKLNGSSDPILSLINAVSDTDSAFNQGQLQVFPIDFYTGTFKDKDGSEIEVVRHYPPFEDVVWSWLTNDRGTTITKDIDLKEIDNFFKSDPMFKHQLFAGIKVDYTDDSDKAWKTPNEVLSSSRANEFSVDITKVFAPIYSVSDANRIDSNSKEFSDLELRFFNRVAETNPLDSTDPAIDGKPIISIKEDGSISFDTPILVNAAWINQFATEEPVPTGVYELLSFNLVNGTFEFKNNSDDIVQQAVFAEAINYLPKEIGNVYERYVFTKKNNSGSVTLMLKPKSKQVYFGITSDTGTDLLSGTILDYNSDGKLLIDTNKGWYELQVDNSIYGELGRTNNQYLGYFTDDAGQKFSVTINGSTIIYNAYAVGEQPIRKDIDKLDENIDAFALSKLRELRGETKMDVSHSIQTDSIGSFNFVFGENVIPALELNKNSDSTIPEGNWILFAYSKNTLYLYNQNDLATTVEVNVNNINKFVDNIQSNVKFTDLLANITGLESDVIKQILKDSVTGDPQETLSKIIDNVNNLFEQDFLKLDSDASESKIISFNNNEFMISSKSDYDVNFKKLIYKALKEEFGEDFVPDNILDWANIDNDTRKLTVRFEVNGNEIERTYIKDSDGIRTYVAPSNPSQFEDDYNKFKTDLVSRRALLMEQNQTVIMDDDSRIALEDELGLIGEQLKVLERVDKMLSDIKNKQRVWNKNEMDALKQDIERAFSSSSQIITNYMLNVILNC